MRSSISDYTKSCARAAVPVSAQPCVSIPATAQAGGGKAEAPSRSGQAGGSTVLQRSTYVSKRKLVPS